MKHWPSTSCSVDPTSRRMPGPSGHTETEASPSKGWRRGTRSLNAPKSAPLSSAGCVHAASCVLGLLENHPHQAGLLHLEANSGSSVPFHICLPLPHQLLFPTSPCEGGCQCLDSGTRRSRSGLSLSLLPQASLLTTSHRCSASL